jgi:hypothetical protein
MKLSLAILTVALHFTFGSFGLQLEAVMVDVWLKLEYPGSVWSPFSSAGADGFVLPHLIGVSRNSTANNTVQHEFGHAYQVQVLGPLTWTSLYALSLGRMFENYLAPQPFQPSFTVFPRCPLITITSSGIAWWQCRNFKEAHGQH